MQRLATSATSFAARCSGANRWSSSSRRLRRWWRRLYNPQLRALFVPGVQRATSGRNFMPTEVVMPQMGESITEGTITKWLKKPGDTVQRDEPLFEISTDKVDAEIPSPAAGTLAEIKIAEGTTVQINTVVCTISESGAAAVAVTPAAAAPAKAE